MVDASRGQFAQVSEERGGTRGPVLAEVEAAGDGLLDDGEVAPGLRAVVPQYPQLVTRAATRMEAAGLLRREPHPGDRRLVRLLLTERGRALEGVIAAETDKLTERALATFGPGERETIVRALADIRRNLSGA